MGVLGGGDADLPGGALGDAGGAQRRRAAQRHGGVQTGGGRQGHAEGRGGPLCCALGRAFCRCVPCHTNEIQLSKRIRRN